MEAIGLFVMLEARPGKEADAEAFLKSAQPLALDEKATLKWYAIKLGPGKFGIFDTFANEAGRNTHLTGEIAKALTARANELFAVPPQVQKVEILANTPLKGLMRGFAVRKRLALKGDYKWQTQRKQQLLPVPRAGSERVSSKRS
jgi:quinol monooxygenase YgiN